MNPKFKIITYKKGDWITRKFKERFLFKDGYKVVSEEEVKKYSPALGCLLFILFPPLAFFGFRKEIKVTYQLK